MKPYRILEIGSKYSKNELSVLLDQPALKYVREGAFACTNSKSYLLFVDLEKTGKVTRFHFNDFFEKRFSLGFANYPTHRQSKNSGFGKRPSYTTSICTFETKGQE